MRAINYIIVHHSASDDVPISTIRDWHVKGNGWKDVGYHYYIRQSGEIEVGRMEEEVGAHCKGQNSNSIGICLAGDFTKSEPEKKQIFSLRKLILSLKERHDIQDVFGHKDAHGANTRCPGFSVDDYLLRESDFGI